ncbi:MAG: VenA family class IV lanthipeptide [Pseudonocardiales bacterium]|nr:VenA family class IV lanthipeptide [Pseudonocardiales bacterium]MBV9031793.1 VenA family class IV lanthipeptide [Pseudonocardiales bacterium]
MNSFNLVSSLHALSETDPVEVDGIQFGGGGGGTCGQQCVVLSVQIIQTVCVISSTCC